MARSAPWRTGRLCRSKTEASTSTSRTCVPALLCRSTLFASSLSSLFCSPVPPVSSSSLTGCTRNTAADVDAVVRIPIEGIVGILLVACQRQLEWDAKELASAEAKKKKKKQELQLQPKTLKQKLAELEKKLAMRDRDLAKKDQDLAKKDRELANKDRELANKERDLARARGLS